MDESILFGFAAFGCVACVAYFLTTAFTSGDDGKLRSRLRGEATAPVEKKSQQKAVPLLTRMGQAAAKPFMPDSREKQGVMRRQLGYAGIYTPSAVRTVVGAKVICLALGVIGGYVVGALTNSMFMSFPIGGLFGYMLPRFWLAMKIKDNQKSIEYGLADALDLMVVCVEAGLTVDSAMQRVGMELTDVHPALSRELAIAHMETRVGLSRSESLKNLGVRTGNVALQALAAMLIQADRFGTSIAQALRVHSESLRLTRQHKAEEMAAKSSVKMSFPLVLFIFPATFIVLAGPTVIELMKSPLMK